MNATDQVTSFINQQAQERAVELARSRIQAFCKSIENALKTLIETEVAKKIIAKITNID